MQGSATNVVIGMPLYSDVGAAGLGDAGAPRVSKIHMFHALSGLTSAAVGAALISASFSVTEVVISAGQSLSAAALSATLGIICQFPNTLTSAGFLTTASGTGWTSNSGSNPSALSAVGIVPSALSQRIFQETFTAPVVSDQTLSPPPQLSAAWQKPYLPQLFPTYQYLHLSASTGVSCTWIHYGSIIEFG